MATRNLEILKLFLLFPEKDFSVRDISKSVNASLAGCYWIIQDLLFQGFVKKTNSYPARYSLDKDLLKPSNILESCDNSFKLEVEFIRLGGANEIDETRKERSIHD